MKKPRSRQPVIRSVSPHVLTAVTGGGGDKGKIYYEVKLVDILVASVP